jgi:hypothetical protein
MWQVGEGKWSFQSRFSHFPDEAMGASYNQTLRSLAYYLLLIIPTKSVLSPLTYNCRGCVILGSA